MRALALIAACGVSVASADEITPDNKLVIEFQTAGEYNLTPDVLFLNFGLTDVISPFTNRIASMHDGDDLLGTHIDGLFGGHQGLLNLDPSNVWKTPGNIFTFLNPEEIDFTTIQDGTIEGRIEYTVQTGIHDVPLNQVNLTMGMAIGEATTLVVSPAPTITSIMVMPIGGGCDADCNADGDLNILDFVCFQAEWQKQSEAGDCNGDGVYNILDFVCYQGLFVAGCG